MHDSAVDAEMGAPTSPPVAFGDVTPMAPAAVSDDEDLPPEKLDFEGASGVIDHPEASDIAGIESSAGIGKRLFGKQPSDKVRPPRSRSRSVGSDAPGLASSGSSMSADSRKLLTKNQKKKLRANASKVRKTDDSDAAQ